MSWHAVDTQTERRDPYLAWSEANRFAGHASMAGVDGAAVPIPVLVELNRAEDINDPALSSVLNIPGLCPRAMPRSRFCTGTVDRADLQALQAQVRRFEFSLPLPANIGAVDTASPPRRDLVERRVVIGLIDRDCAFLNTVFRGGWTGDGRSRSRLLALWDQGHPATKAPWQRPVGLGYGREIDSVAAQAFVTRAANGESEESLYRELEYMIDERGALLSEAHGTHVLDTATGLVTERTIAASAKPAEPDLAQTCDFVFVNLPTPAGAESTGARADVFVIDAIRYIVDRAGPNAQVVINMSVGVQAGAHDESSLAAAATEDLLDRMPSLNIVGAGGNAADEFYSATGLLGLADAQAADSTATLSWCLLAADYTDSFMELWWHGSDEKPAEAVDLRVIPPGGTASPWVEVGETVALHTANGRLAMRVSHRESGSLGKDRMALLSVAPVDGPRAAAVPGRWKIEMRNRSRTQAVIFDAWIQRDDPPRWQGTLLQSYLEDRSDEQRGEGNTLSNLTIAKSVIAVGACTLVDGTETSYSARPGRLASKRAKRDVDVLAPADETPGVAGLYAADVISDLRWRMSGTSVSAPIVTRLLAHRLCEGQGDFAAPAGGPGLSGAAARRALLRSLSSTQTARGLGAAPSKRPGVRKRPRRP